MITDLQTLPTREALADIETATLRAELASVIGITARVLSYLALVWRELESRGEDLTDLRTGLGIYLPLIAEDRLCAEFVIKHAGQHQLLQAAAQVPISLQRELLYAETVEVVDIYEGGTPYTVAVPLARLRPPQIRRVFRDGGLRNPVEQLALIGINARDRRTNAPRETGVHVDGKAKTLRIGNRAAPLDKVLDVLSKYYDVDIRTALASAAPKE